MTTRSRTRDTTSLPRSSNQMQWTIASAWMLAFTLSLDDFVIASFTTGPGATTLPIRIYSQVRLGVKPETNAICTLMIASVALIVVAASLLSKRYAMSDEKHAAIGAPM